MRREHWRVEAPELGGAGGVMAYGHYGRPLLAFASENGRCTDWEDRGMVHELSGLITDGRLKLYVVDSDDGASWSNRSAPLEDRARRHEAFERWICGPVYEAIANDSGGRGDVMVAGSSLGAYHAANIVLRNAHQFALGICMSGVYDMSHDGWGERGDAFYFNNPMDYVANLEGDHLAWLRDAASLLLVCGQGQWEDTTGALESTKAFGGLLAEKGLRHEVDLWGHDSAHDWPWWRRQIAHHVPRFC